MKKLLCFILMFGIVGCQNENERTLQKNDTDILKIASSSQNNKELSEMITDDLVLTKENSPYDLNGNTIQVARGVTVTINPGVEIKNGSIKLWGDLKAIGTETEKITFNGVTLNLESWENSTVYIDHATIISRSGSYFYRSFVNGSITLKNSTLKGGTVDIYEPRADSLIENNLFTEGSTLDITSTYRKTTVRRNTFYNKDSKEDILYNFTNMNTTNLLIEENNFLVPNKIAVRMQNTSSGTTVHAKNNYWGTDNDEVIQSMIHDGKDSLEDNAIVDYQPFLTEAVAEAPLIQILKAPITNKVTENSTEVTGSPEVGTTIILTSRGTVIGTGVTDEDGTFNISIPGQTANSIIEVVAKDNKGNKSVSMKVVVEKTEPEEIDEFSGIISKDIILTKENSPYDLNGNTVQVARAS